MLFVRCTVLLFALHASCLPGAVYQCDDNSDCGDNGRCESTSYCSFADTTCASGLRYDDYAGNGLANECVGGPNGCPSDALHNPANDHCYLELRNDTDWNDAQQICLSIPGGGWRLADIRDAAENSFLAAFLDNDIEYWIGGTDQNNEGTWVWTDGTPLSGFDNWTGNSPNMSGSNDDDCIEFSGPQGSWRDNECFDERDFVCERG